MAISRNQKVETLARLKETVASQKAVVLLTTLDSKETLDASKNVDLRKKSAEKGMKMEIVKNTLIPLAFEKTGNIPAITGQTFLVYMKDHEDTDEVTVPKNIVDIIKGDFKDNISVLGAVVGDEFYDKAKTIALSKTLTKADSMAMIAGLLQQIGGGKIATLVQEVPASIARGVKEVANQKS